MKRIAVFGFLSVVIMLWASCQKELSTESNVNNAVFGFHDTSNVCFPVETHGTYYDGVSAARDTNFITVVVNITKTGDYNIITDSSNGFYFSASGFFSKTGLDTLILKAGGRPILEKQTQFTFPSDSLGSCGFSVDVLDSTGTGLGGVDTGSGDITFADSSYVDDDPASEQTWHFTDSITRKPYSGTFADSATITLEDDVYTLTFGGFSTDLSQLFGADLDLPGGSIKTGVYQFLNSDNDLGLLSIADGTAVYDSDADVAEAGISNSYVTITSYDATTRQLKGSFHCWAEDENGDNLTLLKGSFNTVVSKN